MDQPSTNKQQRPSRCREWERQRRLKFNDAISKLGEIVKSINKTNSASGEEVNNAQYPKIEIVQKAIICLTNCVQEKTQLKAEILALEVKLEDIEKQKHNKKDVSLQVTLGVNKNQNSKYLKLLMLQKSKQNSEKEKAKPVNDTTKPKTEKKTSILRKSPSKLPKLLPLTNFKKENAILMLPATPYIFPQRPVLFPQPPTIVLVETNLQSLSKPATIPVVNRNTNDITKTTMVNVLPISAYTHSLSDKIKKNIAKPRSNVTKKTKKVKTAENKENSDIIKNSIVDSEQKPEEKVEDGKIEINEDNPTMAKEDSKKDKNIQHEVKSDKPSPKNTPTADKEPETTVAQNTSKETNESHKVVNSPNCCEPTTIIEKSETINTTSLSQNEKSVNVTNIESKCDKRCLNKPAQECKSKDTKMQNILDPGICENVVDGGNARLELAEEFLAASPTAAFLMSFPLVSGNRADSPAEEANPNTKENNQSNLTPTEISFFDKSNSLENKAKANKSLNNENVTNTSLNPVSKSNDQPKYENNKSIASNLETKTTIAASGLMTNENPFLNLPLPSGITSSCTLADTSFTMDFDCSVTKTVTTQVTTYVTTSNNLFYKSDPFNTVKSSIYSTSAISSGHEFNSLGLYPCAMENYSNKNKTDFTNVEDNLMKINTSRLTYDIDLGWSHKGFDFVNCTTSANSLHKDNLLNNTPTPFSTAYNPFNPEFHVPLVPNTSKKNPASKSNTLPEQITSFCNQGTNLWSEDVSSIYANSSVSKNFVSKQQNYFPTEHLHSNINVKTSVAKPFDIKQISENNTEGTLKSSSATAHHVVDKYTKKSPNKMHINWMTSEIRPMQNNCNQSQAELKETNKVPYSQNGQVTKKQVQNDGNYFPINMHQFPSQSNHEELHVWPTTRPAGTTEISMEPPPINLPTLVGDLALGPHDKKRADALNRTLPHTDLQNCSSFLSVTQLMNRSNENMPLRSNGLIAETQKTVNSKQNLPLNEVNRKSRLENHPQICYGFSDSKVAQPYENINHFTQSKVKSNKPDKSSKTQKNSYSAEALIRGGTTCSQKVHDNNGAKFMMPQKFNDFNITQDSGVAQVSHFPPILDYSDNSYAGQQYSGTTLYNSTTNTISNSFYSNFMPGSTNLMTSNYTGGPFPSDFIDYNQTPECNSYPNHKYGDIKIRNNTTTFSQEKEVPNYKSTRRESAAKHKLECSKKESSKKYQSKRPKLGNEVDEWSDTAHLLWQNKTQTKRHQNMMSEELTFPNYMGNQMPSQYQPDFFNSHIMQTNMQNVGTNVDRSLSGFPVTSRANFNLSAIFPEITMKVQ